MAAAAGASPTDTVDAPPYLAWSEHFVTGLPTIDAQHRGLVELVNQVALGLSARATLDVGLLSPLLDRLTAYAAVHFRDEEALMSASLHPDYLAEHCAKHEAFVGDVLGMRRRLSSDDHLDGESLLRFLSAWLTFHILGDDQAMARQLRDVAAGRTPEVAMRAAEAARAAEGSSHAVLHGALLDLFGLYAARNRALAQTNAALESAKGALTTLNAHLEDEVLARTAELRHTNEALSREQAELRLTNAQLKAAQTALIQSEKQRAVGQLAAGLAHELNTPLQYVSSNHEFVGQAFTTVERGLLAWRRAADAHADDGRALTSAAAGELGRLKLDYLLREAPLALEQSGEGLARMGKIIRAMQDFAEPTSDTMAPVQLADCLANTIIVSRQAWEAVAEVQVAIDPGLPEVHGRRQELNQVLLNLITNAADAIRNAARAEEKGRIRITASASDTLVELRVTDTGTGIPDEVRGRVFEPFFTTKEVGRGTGQGLAVVYAIVVTGHGGNVSFETELGVGTTFIVRLPRVNPTAAPR